MSYTLLIGEYAYSDNSFRGWLELDAFGIAFKPNYVPLFSDEFQSVLAEHVPASALPILLEGAPGTDALSWEGAATVEILAERHADSALWPAKPETRETARALAARARTGFTALQGLPMNLHERYQGFQPSEEEQSDADQLTALWAWSLSASGGPYLCGAAFSAADAAFAPIATRLITYGFEVTGLARTYVEALYAHPSFRRWHACADAQLRKIDSFHRDLPSGSNSDWPRPPVLPGRHYEGDVADAINEACPYSGKPIVADSLAEIDGQVIGFCNQFCCRRGMADAESWPTVMAMLERSSAQAAMTG